MPKQCPAKAQSRAQASAELLIVLAALAAFFAALAPAALAAMDAARATAAMRSQEAAAERIASLARQSALLHGSVLEDEVKLAAGTRLSAADGRIKASFAVAGRNITVEREAAGVKDFRAALEAGRWEVKARSGGLEFGRPKEK